MANRNMNAARTAKSFSDTREEKFPMTHHEAGISIGLDYYPVSSGEERAEAARRLTWRLLMRNSGPARNSPEDFIKAVCFACGLQKEGLAWRTPQLSLYILNKRAILEQDGAQAEVILDYVDYYARVFYNALCDWLKDDYGGGSFENVPHPFTHLISVGEDGFILPTPRPRIFGTHELLRSLNLTGFDLQNPYLLREDRGLRISRSGDYVVVAKEGEERTTVHPQTC